MRGKKPQEYTVEREGAVEYVVVRCPQGHRLRGMKSGELKALQHIVCPECGLDRDVLAPLTNGMELSV